MLKFKVHSLIFRHCFLYIFLPCFLWSFKVKKEEPCFSFVRSFFNFKNLVFCQQPRRAKVSNVRPEKWSEGNFQMERGLFFSFFFNSSIWRLSRQMTNDSAPSSFVSCSKKLTFHQSSVLYSKSSSFPRIN